MPSFLNRLHREVLTSGTQIFLLAIGFYTPSPLLRLGCISLVILISFFAWYGALRRYRLVADLPTSLIGSAAQGYVELLGTGRMVEGWKLPSRIGGQNCLWQRWLVEQKNQEGKWETVDRGESTQSFLIDDGTGVCLVDPSSAEILVKDKDVRDDGEYRTTEWRFTPGESIYALGEFRTRNLATELDTAAEISGLLEQWKRDRPLLLKRFDLDRDGEISLQEWEAVRAAARREVERSHAEIRQSADFHTLSSPGQWQIYLLSNIRPEKIERRYFLWAFFHLILFFAGLAAIPTVIR